MQGESKVMREIVLVAALDIENVILIGSAGSGNGKTGAGARWSEKGGDDRACWRR